MTSKSILGLPILCLLSIAQTTAAQTPGASSTIPQGTLHVKSVPDKPLFAVGDSSGVNLQLYADNTVKITSIKQVSLIDDVTGRPASQAINDIKLDKEIKATEVEPFTLAFAKPWQELGHSYTGVLAVTYKLDGADAVALVNFALVDPAFRSTNKPREAELKARDPDAKVSIGAGQTALKFCVVAAKGDVLIDHVATEIIDDGTKNPLQSGTITWTGPKRVGPDSTNSCFESAIPEDILTAVSSATGRVSLSYRAAAGGNAAAASWNFLLFRPVLDVRAVDSRVQLERRYPLWPERSCFDLRYRTIPAGNILPNNLKFDVEAVGPAGNFRIPGVVLSQGDPKERKNPSDQGDQDGQKLFLCVDVPSDITTLQGHVWIQPPLSATEIELKPLLTMKDRARWRALAIVVAYLVALAVTWGAGEVRRRLLHDARRQNIFARLGVFLSSNAGLSDDDSVVLIRQMLSDSKLQDAAGNTDLAEEKLASAETRLEQLRASPPPTREGTASTEIIRVSEPQSHRLAGRELSLKILSFPDEWKESDTFAWSVIKPGNESKVIASAPRLTGISHVFETEGEYSVQVTANNHSEQRKIIISHRKTLSRAQRLRRLLGFLNLAPTVVGAVLAAAAAYLTTANAASWGTAGDYLTLFLTAFGLSAGTQALSPILAAIRRG